MNPIFEISSGGVEIPLTLISKSLNKVLRRNFHTCSVTYYSSTFFEKIIKKINTSIESIFSEIQNRYTQHLRHKNQYCRKNKIDNLSI